MPRKATAAKPAEPPAPRVDPTPRVKIEPWPRPWISIQDQLPPRENPILYLINPGRGLPPHIGVGWWVSGQWVPGLQTFQNPVGITHWLPIPEFEGK